MLTYQSHPLIIPNLSASYRRLNVLPAMRICIYRPFRGILRPLPVSIQNDQPLNVFGCRATCFYFFNVVVIRSNYNQIVESSAAHGHLLHYNLLLSDTHIHTHYLSPCIIIVIIIIVIIIVIIIIIIIIYLTFLMHVLNTNAAHTHTQIEKLPAPTSL